MSVLLMTWFEAFKTMQQAVLSNNLHEIREANVRLRNAYEQVVDFTVICPESRQGMRRIEGLAQGPDAVRQLEEYFSQYQGEFPPTA